MCKISNSTAKIITLKPGVLLAMVERIDINAISVMENVAKTVTQTQE